MAAGSLALVETIFNLPVRINQGGIKYPDTGCYRACALHGHVRVVLWSEGPNEASHLAGRSGHLDRSIRALHSLALFRVAVAECLIHVLGFPLSNGVGDHSGGGYSQSFRFGGDSCHLVSKSIILVATLSLKAVFVEILPFMY